MCVDGLLLKEKGGRRGGGGAADAALKTKTPHVNVGNKAFCTGPSSKTKRSVPGPSSKKKAFCSGPLSKTKRSVLKSIKQNNKVVKRIFYIMLTCTLFVQKSVYTGPSAKCKHSATGPLSRAKDFVTRSGNKTKQL